MRDTYSSIKFVPGLPDGGPTPRGVDAATALAIDTAHLAAFSLVVTGAIARTRPSDFPNRMQPINQMNTVLWFFCRLRKFVPLVNQARHSNQGWSVTATYQ